mmetsp:Transcript_9704/g.16644  ORF Transcript_9704/g.16644 Transcript_9704/m.16644 type:complete len:214 (+) Transcript_9704:1-642(+)
MEVLEVAAGEVLEAEVGLQLHPLQHLRPHTLLQVALLHHVHVTLGNRLHDPARLLCIRQLLHIRHLVRILRFAVVVSEDQILPPVEVVFAGGDGGVGKGEVAKEHARGEGQDCMAPVQPHLLGLLEHLPLAGGEILEVFVEHGLRVVHLARVRRVGHQQLAVAIKQKVQRGACVQVEHAPLGHLLQRHRARNALQVARSLVGEGAQLAQKDHP